MSDENTPDNVSPDGDAEDPKAEESTVGDGDVDPVAAAAAGELAEALDERTRDLQRVTAEYHNYRKRVERDRQATAEQATVAVVSGLLPVLDDIDRARDHGDLVGPFASVAEQLQNSLTKLGLESFGDKGDRFDPMVHEAVAHMHSAEVTEPTCIDVMRRGYRMGERLVRAAMVAVAEPSDEPAPAVTEEAVSDETGTEDTTPATPEGDATETGTDAPGDTVDGDEPATGDAEAADTEPADTAETPDRPADDNDSESPDTGGDGTDESTAPKDK
ncbi:molecular chaperone GrpE (heat shock protein) [Stackebrandtia albiflava]|uniref:Protein GrpE n=1 Tax=Stackebrandtia albiflava TaxID=406432 RepID=A0A562V0P0_9ACTN|nr:nucleotide exchange factor GrpE [Stackebrandtia albiflava]TWJ11451.1 molecular chaperone GrpE (heat shock protein) [Stackebrandtia albiflava]